MSVEILPTPAEAVAPLAVHPWQRYCARMIDIQFFGLISIVAIGFIGGIVAPEPVLRFFNLMEKGFLGTVLANVFTIGVTVPVIACFGAWTGTPGKWIFDIRVREADGRRLSLARSFRREATIWIKGFGFGVPFVSLITLIMSKVRLSEDGKTAWDEAMDCRVHHAAASVLGYVKKTMGVALVILALVYNYAAMIKNMMSAATS
ncbi:RDD family protein [Luteimonas gilva]|uniref:RDD family protein n=1 Tax=Luteimonas gilva TaxID=2572684 RepID=A0A4V5ZPL3_9GAMM|nr:RDD family protein [Luteimonas gilva]TKR29493.1 RDD family protein [Luteimonas gilva]